MWYLLILHKCAPSCFRVHMCTCCTFIIFIFITTKFYIYYKTLPDDVGATPFKRFYCTPRFLFPFKSFPFKPFHSLLLEFTWARQPILFTPFINSQPTPSLPNNPNTLRFSSPNLHAQLLFLCHRRRPCVFLPTLFRHPF